MLFIFFMFSTLTPRVIFGLLHIIIITIYLVDSFYFYLNYVNYLQVIRNVCSENLHVGIRL